MKHRYDFIYLFDAIDANPNGDPDAGNLPRTDAETGHGLVTDVCIKRKIRNFVGGFKWLAQSARLAMGQGLCEASGSIAKPNRKPYEPLQPPDPRATLHP